MATATPLGGGGASGDRDMPDHMSSGGASPGPRKRKPPPKERTDEDRALVEVSEDDGPHLPPVSELERDAAESTQSCWGRVKANLMYTPSELTAGQMALEARKDIAQKARDLRDGKIPKTASKSAAWFEALDALSMPEHPLLAAEKRVKPTTIRGKMMVVLESDATNLVVLCLIVLDVIAVFGELLLSSFCLIERDPVHNAEVVLATFSLTILFIFAAQQLGLIIAEGPTAYFTNFWYVLDLLVVASSITFDLAINHPEGGLVILLMSWRIVRVVHGFITTVELQREQARHFRHEIESMTKRIGVLTQWRIIMLRSRRLTTRAQKIKTVIRQWRKYRRLNPDGSKGAPGGIGSGARAAGESKAGPVGNGHAVRSPHTTIAMGGSSTSAGESKEMGGSAMSLPGSVP